MLDLFYFRLRIAQEIQRRLEEVEEKQKELEIRGVTLEKALRGETFEEDKEEEELLQEWFELVRERNELRRYEKELFVRAQEMELEDRHARLQQELRHVLAKDGEVVFLSRLSFKTDEMLKCVRVHFRLR